MRYTFLVTLLLSALSTFGQHPKIRNDSAQEKMDLAPATVYTYVEQMPEPAYDITKYLNENIVYPEAAALGGVQGRVIVKFIVNEDGSVSDCKIEKGIGSGCDEEAIRVLRSMPKWKPGIRNGQAVRVSTMLPVNFALKKPRQVYNYVEQPPSSGFDLPGYLSKNLRYQESANMKNILGRVFVKFVINEDGSVSDCVVVRGIGGGCDEEALRVVNKMPLWKPGMQQGKPVKVYFTLPIQFKLTD